jgi:hypothetical protein
MREWERDNRDWRQREKKKEGRHKRKEDGGRFSRKKEDGEEELGAYLKGVEAGLYLDSSCLYVFS